MGKLDAVLGMLKTAESRGDEAYIVVGHVDFAKTCVSLHKELAAPVALLFATDDRRTSGGYGIWCGFRSFTLRKWVFAQTSVAPEHPAFENLSRSIHSASFFEREIQEMFGIEPKNAPDTRRLRLHEEVWPRGFYPLRKDFHVPGAGFCGLPDYQFARGEGEGIFEVPVGPVHAGIIGPGHFRFSAAGEPIVNLEIRLGFTHRGVEKLFEGKNAAEAVWLAECVSGDAAFGHSLAFCRAVEKICGVEVPPRAQVLRAVFLELERMYNHAADIGGIAVDVGFSFPAAQAALIKEAVQRMNGRLTGSRFLKGINVPGGLLKDIDEAQRSELASALGGIRRDSVALRAMLEESVSFMDRVDSTGILKRTTAFDLGITGLAGRASGIAQDLRKDSGEAVYERVKFKAACEQSGDVLARLRVRFTEFEESLRMLEKFVAELPPGTVRQEGFPVRAGYALGAVEGWRGPVLYWVRVNADGALDRCKIVDASFLNWQGLAYCVLGDIIPDFPVCNKSFDLSYSGNDL